MCIGMCLCIGMSAPVGLGGEREGVWVRERVCVCVCVCEYFYVCVCVWYSPVSMVTDEVIGQTGCCRVRKHTLCVGSGYQSTADTSRKRGKNTPAISFPFSS